MVSFLFLLACQLGWGRAGRAWQGPARDPFYLGEGGACAVPMAMERQASVLGRSAPSRSKGLSAAHPRRWAAWALSLGLRGGCRVQGSGQVGSRGKGEASGRLKFLEKLIGFRVMV